MKPYRVKRGGKLIGNFIVVHEGRRVNLRTKDASEARRRAALLVRGDWPEGESSDARAVKDSIEGVGVESADEAVSAALPANPAPPIPVAPPAEIPPVSPPAGVPLPGPVPDPVAAVNATVAASDEIEVEAKAALSSMGVDLGELGPKLPGYVGKGLTVVTGYAAKLPVRFIAGQWPERPKLPDEVAVIEPVMGKCLLVKAAQWGIDLERMGPGWWLLILLGFSTVIQVGVALSALEAKAEGGKPDIKPVP